MEKAIIEKLRELWSMVGLYMQHETLIIRDASTKALVTKICTHIIENARDFDTQDFYEKVLERNKKQ